IARVLNDVFEEKKERVTAINKVKSVLVFHPHYLLSLNSSNLFVSPLPAQISYFLSNNKRGSSCLANSGCESGIVLHDRSSEISEASQDNILDEVIRGTNWEKESIIIQHFLHASIVVVNSTRSIAVLYT
ncbi:hypothetical protein WUBG_01404, partial [Wuchereria bancrofti]